jgi:hypothetical protein
MPNITASIRSSPLTEPKGDAMDQDRPWASVLHRQLQRDVQVVQLLLAHAGKVQDLHWHRTAQSTGVHDSVAQSCEGSQKRTSVIALLELVLPSRLQLSHLGR